MTKYRANSGQDVIYVNYSNSGIAAMPVQSTADPMSFASLMAGMFSVERSYTLTPACIDKEQPTWQATADKVLSEHAELWERLSKL